MQAFEIWTNYLEETELILASKNAGECITLECLLFILLSNYLFMILTFWHTLHHAFVAKLCNISLTLEIDYTLDSALLFQLNYLTRPKLWHLLLQMGFNLAAFDSFIHLYFEWPLDWPPLLPLQLLLLQARFWKINSFLQKKQCDILMNLRGIYCIQFLLTIVGLGHKKIMKDVT